MLDVDLLVDLKALRLVLELVLQSLLFDLVLRHRGVVVLQVVVLFHVSFLKAWLLSILVGWSHLLVFISVELPRDLQGILSRFLDHLWELLKLVDGRLE